MPDRVRTLSLGHVTVVPIEQAAAAPFATRQLDDPGNRSGISIADIAAGMFLFSGHGPDSTAQPREETS